jgi:hypothetical protein
LLVAQISKDAGWADWLLVGCVGDCATLRVGKEERRGALRPGVSQEQARRVTRT